MSVSQLLKWQWGGYPRYHCSRANLLLHIVAVPLFIVANVTAVVALAERAWLVAALAIAAMVVSVALQGRGHRRSKHRRSHSRAQPTQWPASSLSSGLRFRASCYPGGGHMRCGQRANTSFKRTQPGAASPAPAGPLNSVR